MKFRMVATALGAVLMAAVPGTASATPIADGEQVEARTENSTTVVRPGGARTLTLYAGPVQLLRGAAWEPVDLTLTAGPDGVIRPATTAHDIAMTTTGPVAHFAGGGSAALDWPSVLPAPRLDGHRATYAQARPGYDLMVEATSVGFVASLRRAGAAVAGPVAPLTVLRTDTSGEPDLRLGSYDGVAVARSFLNWDLAALAGRPVEITFG